MCFDIYRRKFRSQTSDNMDRWKAEQGRGREKRKIRRKKSRRERVRRKKMQMREKVGKSRKTVFFQWFVAPEGRKVGSLKRWGAEPAGQMSDEKLHAVVARSRFPSQNVQNTPVSDHFWKLRVEMSKKCTPSWREAHFEVKMYKTHQLRTTFGSCDVEIVHAVVARSTFPSQNVQNTSASDHFWKLRCRKSARRCGAKHISKSKCTKNHMFAPLLEVRMLKKCTPLWREAHFQVKMYKAPHVRATFGGSDVASLRFTTLHYTTLHSTTLQPQLHNYTTTLHYTDFHSATLHYTKLHSSTLHYFPTTLHYITLHYATLHSTTTTTTTT